MNYSNNHHHDGNYTNCTPDICQMWCLRCLFSVDNWCRVWCSAVTCKNICKINLAFIILILTQISIIATAHRGLFHSSTYCNNIESSQILLEENGQLQGHAINFFQLDQPSLLLKCLFWVYWSENVVIRPSQSFIFWSWNIMIRGWITSESTLKCAGALGFTAHPWPTGKISVEHTPRTPS